MRVHRPGSGRMVEEVIVNKNVSWLDSPAVWVCYLCGVILLWLAISAVLTDTGLAWTYVHLIHGVLTYYLLHWCKGSPNPEDLGKYNSLTIWEQLDNEAYGTLNRKVFTIVPVVVFILATHGADFRKQPLGLNLAVVLVLLAAKLPALHKVRFFGINK